MPAPSLTPQDLLRTLEKLVGQRCVLQTVIDGRELPALAVQVLAPEGSGLGYSQLNELLLLLGFDRVTHTFFQFLIDGTTEYTDGAAIGTFEQLEMGVDRFRSLGLLMFGNVKYAFKALSRDAELLEQRLEQLRPVAPTHFTARHEPISPIQPIPADRTYYLGYIIERELKSRLARDPNDVEAQTQETERLTIVDLGKSNQEAYLASDHLDVYVATSMRQRHEFLAVNRLGKAIFSHPDLVDLKLRWFDPTQAYCRDRIDKGLSEALMLRRAKCTIYLAQESDTLGKDSELASTLAQGKPVIAFVPEVSSDFSTRLLTELGEAYPDKRPQELLMEQLQVIEPAAAWTDPLVRQWIENPVSMDLGVAIDRLQQAIARHYDGRARTLQDIHPLGVQVNLATGVANGVLLVRTVDTCAALVRRIMTATLEFSVSEENGATVLREKISNCVFRIATGDVMLSNAFWNFYLDPSE
jgi:hypothetical protein